MTAFPSSGDILPVALSAIRPGRAKAQPAYSAASTEAVVVSSMALWSKKECMAHGRTALYIGRGVVPPGLEGVDLGNPFVIGAGGYTQGTAVSSYRGWLRQQCRDQSPTFSALQALAKRVCEGERLMLVCWCKSKGAGANQSCHGDVLKEAIDGYARLLGVPTPRAEAA